MKARPFLAAALVACLSLLALAVEKPTVAELLKDPAKFDKKEVQVTGTMSEFKQKTSKIGNKYFTLKLKDGNKWVSVYSRGELEHVPKDGTKIQVSGVFRAETKVGENTFKNEIDCSVKEGKKYGVAEVK